MKILILATISAVIVYIGVGYSAFYKKRHRFYEDLLTFLNVYENNLKFAKDSIIIMLEKNKNLFSKPFFDYVNSYFVTKKPYVCLYISPDEKQKIDNYFSLIGKQDEFSELTNIGNYKIDFDSLKQKTKDDVNKFGSLSIKLGVIVGLLCFIIFI